MKFFVLVLAFLAGSLGAQIVPENVTVTSMTVDGVNVAANVPYAVGPDNKNHRFACDALGRLVTSSSISGTGQTAASALPFGLTWTPVEVAGPYYSSVTFTSTSGAANGIAVVLGSVGGTTFSKVVTSYSISTDTNAQLLLHHQSGACVLSNSGNSNFIGGGWFGAGSGERDSGTLCKVSILPNQPVSVDVSTAVTNFFVGCQYYLVR
jgi:hypothetical protein